MSTFRTFRTLLLQSTLQAKEGGAQVVHQENHKMTCARHVRNGQKSLRYPKYFARLSSNLWSVKMGSYTTLDINQWCLGKTLLSFEKQTFINNLQTICHACQWAKNAWLIWDFSKIINQIYFLQVKWNDVDEGYGRHYFEYNHDYKTKAKQPSEDTVPIRRL